MSPILPALRLLASLLVLITVTACTADHKWASDAAVAQARHVDPNRPSVTLFTSINTRTKDGAHAGLLINADERVLYDPAGEFGNDIRPAAVEREDLIYGMGPSMLAAYVNYQGTPPFQVVQQTIYVSPEVAARVKAAAIAHGAANKAACTIAISEVLSGVPGFEGLPRTYFPKAMMRGFAKLPGVLTRTLTSQSGDLRFSLPGTPSGASLDAAPGT